MKKIISFIISMMLCMNISAQQKPTYTMEGVVVDEFGATAIGVSVYLKDKVGVGTTTDTNGKFSIKAQHGDILVISYIGFETIELPVSKEDKNLKIQLSESKQQLDEVVVMGVGSKRKISQVGALSTVDVGQLQVPTTSVANLMGGKIAGVITMMTSGEPGKNISDFWVRGIGTFGYNSGALVLIDGLEGDINSIDPADIESFSILKDASATAVYGVRGANGVVIITTKKGQSGKLNITARANVSLSHLKRLPDYLGAYDYALLANEAKAVRGDMKLYNDIEMDIIRKGLDPDMYPDVNWQDVVLNENSWKQNYYLSARGGGEVARYFISLGGSSETAAYKVDKSSPYSSNVGYNTYNYRLNLDLSLTPTTTVYFGSDGYLTDRREPGYANTDYIWSAQTQLIPLLFPVRYSTGELPAASGDSGISPYVMINHTGRYTNQEYKGKATLALNQDLDFVTKGLKFSIQGSFDIHSLFQERRYVMPSLVRAMRRNANGELVMSEMVRPQPAVYSSTTDQYRKYYMKTTLNYNRLFGKDHRISLLVNYEVEDNKRASDAYDKNQGLNENMRSIPKRYQAVAGWANYSFRDTYLLDINVGYTGTENFMVGKQYGWFPAVGIGWVPSAYSWVKDNLPWLDFLKFRATIGSVGNDRISSRRFPYLTMVASGTGGPFGGNSVGTVKETTTGADNLEWEKSIKSDLGIELRLLQEKLSFTVDIFNDKRDGIFQERVQIPSYVGLVNNPYGNVGKMKSYGADGNGTYTQVINKDINVTLRGNFTYSKNLVQNWEQVYPKYSYQEINGLPSGTVRGFRAMGFFKDQEDILYSPAQTWNTVMPGDIKYMDVNGDGIINDDDMVPLSRSPFPLLMYGFGGEVRYKQLTLGVLFKGTGKTDYYIVDPGDGATGYGYIPFRSGELGNVLSIVKDPRNRWIPRDYAIANGIDPSLAENPNAEFPRLQYGDNVNNRQMSDFWKRDARYLRLQEITLSYNLRNDFLRKIGVTSVDLQFICNNLFVWSKSKLFDPEQAGFNGRKYPIPATYSFQIYVNL